jgi:MHS family proline/betaine transporter-like MFS transporter
MFAGSLGTLIEYYDFSVYGCLAVVIAPQFFPSDDPAASLPAALAVFATGLVVRPVGGVFVGWLGDRWGRRKALVSSVLCMGVAGSITGLLPTYSQIGVTAAVLLLLARLVQGISTGGESVGAYIYVYESVLPRRRAFLGAVTPVGSNLGFMFAAATAGVSPRSPRRTRWPTGAGGCRSSWPWRSPCSACGPGCGSRTPWNSRRPHGAPTSPRLRSGRSCPPTARRCCSPSACPWRGLSMAQGGAIFLGLTYIGIHLSTDLGYDSTQVFWLSAGVVLITVLLMVPAGSPPGSAPVASCCSGCWDSW